MARRGRKAVVVELAEGEREILEGWVRRHKSSQALVLRSRVVLAAADGEANVDIARQLGCSAATASKWRRRFVELGLGGLSDAPRSGQPRKWDDDKVYELVVKTLNEKPVGATHWSVRSMAAAAGVTRSFVHRVWQTFELKPHLTQEFKVSPDEHFTEKLTDIVGLYLNPPESAVVLCLDEKTQTAGPGPHRCDPAAAADHTRAQNTRLPQARHSGPARGSRCRHRQSHNRYDRPSQSQRIPLFLGPDRHTGTLWLRCAHSAGQRLHPHHR